MLLNSASEMRTMLSYLSLTSVKCLCPCECRDVCRIRTNHSRRRLYTSVHMRGPNTTQCHWFLMQSSKGTERASEGFNFTNEKSCSQEPCAKLINTNCWREREFGLFNGEEVGSLLKKTCFKNNEKNYFSRFGLSFSKRGMTLPFPITYRQWVYAEWASGKLLSRRSEGHAPL